MRQQKKKENHKSISLRNIYSKMLNKIPVKRTHSHLKNLSILTKYVGFNSERQGWLNIFKLINVINHMNGFEDKNYMIISINAEKGHWQNITWLHNNGPRQSRTRGNIIKFYSQYQKGYI